MEKYWALYLYFVKGEQRMTNLDADKIRYGGLNGTGEKMPCFQKYMRLSQQSKCSILKILYKVLFVFFRNRRLIEMSVDTPIGGGIIFWTCIRN